MLLVGFGCCREDGYTIRQMIGSIIEADKYTFSIYIFFFVFYIRGREGLHITHITIARAFILCVRAERCCMGQCVVYNRNR